VTPDDTTEKETEDCRDCEKHSNYEVNFIVHMRNYVVRVWRHVCPDKGVHSEAGKGACCLFKECGALV